MTDEEINRKCADKMGIVYSEFDDRLYIAEMSDADGGIYDPLHDDAQAMALVKALGLTVVPVIEHGQNILYCWAVSPPKKCTCDEPEKSIRENLNRAICECVAKLPD